MAIKMTKTSKKSVKRSKGSSHVPNGVAQANPAMSGPMGVPPEGGGMVAPPMMAPKMPGM